MSLVELLALLETTGAPPPGYRDVDLRHAWEVCDDPRALYFVGGACLERRALVAALVACIEPVVAELPANDPRPHAVVALTRRWLGGAATLAEVEAAYDAARTALDSAAGDVDAYVAINALLGPASVAFAPASQRAPARAIHTLSCLETLLPRAEVVQRLRAHLPCPTLAALIASYAN